MKNYLFYTLSLSILLLSCNQQPAASKIQVDTASYQSEPIAGSAFEHLTRRDAGGNLVEEGFMLNGTKEGTWVTYFPEKGFPKTVESFAGGTYNGVYLGFNDRGHVELRAGYKNNLLDGFWATYKFGRETETRSYKNGQLDGVVRKYNDRTGKLLEEIHYKNGQYDGPYRFYNEEGQITVEYIYKAGTKVSGGEIRNSGS